MPEITSQIYCLFRHHIWLIHMSVLLALTPKRTVHLSLLFGLFSLSLVFNFHCIHFYRVFLRLSAWWGLWLSNILFNLSIKLYRRIVWYPTVNIHLLFSQRQLCLPQQNPLILPSFITNTTDTSPFIYLFFYSWAQFFYPRVSFW